MNILITGATGLIGNYWIAYALEKGIKVMLGISRTDAINNEEHFSVSHAYPAQLIETFKIMVQNLEKFSLTSSKVTMEPNLYINTTPSSGNMCETASDCCKSRKKNNQNVKGHAPFPYVILSSPFAFGNRDKGLFVLIKIIYKKIESAIGVMAKMLSPMYVKDLPRGILKYTVSLIENKKYIKTSRQLHDNARLGKKIIDYSKVNAFKVKLALFTNYTLTFFSEIYAKITGNSSLFKLAKMKKINYPNWIYDNRSFHRVMAIESNYILEMGTVNTID